MSTSSYADLKEYVKLKEQKIELKKQLSEIEADIVLYQETLVEELLQDGVTSMKLDGRTIYMHRQMWARVVPANEGGTTQEDRHRALEALGQLGLREQFENLNYQALSAWARRQEDGLPTELEGAISLDEEITLRVRKS